MQLKFIYCPVTDLEAATLFYGDELGWEEAWREGTDTVAFWLPGRGVQVMLSLTGWPAGPQYLVGNLVAWIAEHPTLEVSIPVTEIPGGAVAGFLDPAGNVFYVFDRSKA